MDRYIGLDLGTKSLGIAISDTLGIVHAKENFNFKEGYYKLARDHLATLIKETNINKIVIGLPLQIDRNEGKRCKSVRRFIDDLIKENDLNIEVFYQDESYSTFEAKERLENEGLSKEKIKEKIDMISAVVILEDFLNNLK